MASDSAAVATVAKVTTTSVVPLTRRRRAGPRLVADIHPPLGRDRPRLRVRVVARQRQGDGDLVAAAREAERADAARHLDRGPVLLAAERSAHDAVGDRSAPCPRIVQT